MRRLANLNELFVHHEDVRRANGFGLRLLPPAEDAALFCTVARSARLLSRHLRGIGLDVEWTGTGEVVRARRGRPIARVSGAPGELLLFLFGRRDVAEVVVSGSAEAVVAVRQTSFGI